MEPMNDKIIPLNTLHIDNYTIDHLVVSWKGAKVTDWLDYAVSELGDILRYVNSHGKLEDPVRLRLLAKKLEVIAKSQGAKEVIILNPIQDGK